MSDRIKARMKLDNAGLTLVEILVSMVVFAIMLFPMLTGFNSLLKQNKTAKVNQAEIDYAARVMEQFKQYNPSVTDDLASGSANTTVAGYKVSPLPGGGYKYTLAGVPIEKDITDSANNMYGTSQDAARSHVKDYEYRVTVSTDAGAYASSDGVVTLASAGATYEYVDPNNTLAYNLDNIDERFSVLIRDTSLNYDSRALNDLIDKAAKQLADDDPNRYNMWMSGVVNVFVNAKFFKNTYIKVSKKSNGDYVVDATVNYSMYGYKDATISYNLIRGRVYEKEKTGNKPPKIYYYYNQFTQNNLVAPDSDSVSIDNSGLATGTTIEDKDQIHLYLIKSDATTNTDIESEVYTRNAGAGQTYKGRIIPASGDPYTDDHFATYNTEGSVVYTAELGYKSSAKTYYYWPTYVASVPKDTQVSYNDIIQRADVKSISKKLKRTSGPDAIVDELREDGSSYGYYLLLYNNVMVEESMLHSGDLNNYTETTSYGDEVYVCRRNTAYKGVSNYFEKGDVIFKNKERFFVLPDGTILKDSADINQFTDFILQQVNTSIHNKTFVIAKSEKIGYVDIPINVVLAPGSNHETDSGKHSIMIYTNMNQINPATHKPKKIEILSESQFNEKGSSFTGTYHGDYTEYVEAICSGYYNSLFQSDTSIMHNDVIFPGVAGSGNATISGSWQTFTDLLKSIRPLTQDYDESAKKLWRVSLLLERKPVGAADTEYVKVIALTSGKEGK